VEGGAMNPFEPQRHRDTEKKDREKEKKDREKE
jgi:hypothetical protein